MKKLLTITILLLCLAAGVWAEEGTALPQDVINLCGTVHPGYAIAAHDGWGDEHFGQYALILKKGDDNILCMAEKAKEDAAYVLTIDNTNAVYDGEKIPSLMLEGGGDSLFYT